MSTPRRPGAPRSPVGSRPAQARPDAQVRRHRPSTTNTGPVPRIEANRNGSVAGMLTWRTLVLLAVIVLAIAMVAPSVRAYMNQQDELADLRAEVEAAQTEVDDLEADVARWEDPWYVQAQARERLAYVFPGEVPYRVIDPDKVDRYARGSLAQELSQDEVETQEWHAAVWESLYVIGTGDLGLAPEVEDAPAPDDILTDVDFGG